MTKATADAAGAIVDIKPEPVTDAEREFLMPIVRYLEVLLEWKRDREKATATLSLPDCQRRSVAGLAAGQQAARQEKFTKAARFRPEIAFIPISAAAIAAGGFAITSPPDQSHLVIVWIFPVRPRLYRWRLDPMPDPSG